MAENGGDRVRVTLRWIQIKDNKESAWDDEGEFRFRSKVTTAGQAHELKFPEEGFWSISDHPRRNKVEKIDKVLFEGVVGDSMIVELFGEEMDGISANDHLEDYRLEFTGPVRSWVGRHEPTDQGVEDPENLSDWRVCYDVEMV
ncbi:MAG: hypothetical protein OEZ65_07355 [Gemmatimonadota bacterium]|nr:hypothetical protein [Gemmatimonadota bacterium]MDH5759391.1 hypothetical protein [Gemmatimonadota bacterium]